MQYELDKLYTAVIKPRRGSHALRWHVGGDVKGIENVSTIVHSDTLFSALCHACVRLFGRSELEANLRIFASDKPPFRISSIFPMNLTNQEYFVPKPALPIPKPEDKKLYLKYAKSLKKAEFINLDILSKWLKLRAKASPDLYEYDGLYEKIERGTKSAEIFWTGTDMGIGTDRIGKNSPNTFYRASSITQKVVSDYGYYFLVYCQDERYRHLLNVLIEEVSRSGIGGERSIGYGRFASEPLQEVSQKWKDLFDTASTDYLLLSLWYPTKQEISAINRDNARYSLVSRKGWFDSPTGYTFKRKRCNMFGEGSFLSLSCELRGKLVDVSPNIWKKLENNLKGWHPIYRYGTALAFPV